MKALNIDKNTSAATPAKINLADEARKAIESAPSKTLLETEKRKFADLVLQREASIAEIRDLEELQKTEKSNGQNVSEEFLRTGKLKATSTAEDLAVARRKVAVIHNAEKVVSSKISELQQQFSLEVNVALKGLRKSLVERTAAALKDLRAIAGEDAALRKLATDSGVNFMFIDQLVFLPVSGDSAFDTLWFEARRREGFAV